MAALSSHGTDTYLAVYVVPLLVVLYLNLTLKKEKTLYEMLVDISTEYFFGALYGFVVCAIPILILFGLSSSTHILYAIVWAMFSLREWYETEVC